MKELKKPEVFGVEITSVMRSGRACVTTLELKSEAKVSVEYLRSRKQAQAAELQRVKGRVRSKRQGG